MPGLDAIPNAVDSALGSDEAAHAGILARFDRECIERGRVVGGHDELRAIVDHAAHGAVTLAIDEHLVGRVGAVAALEDPVQEGILKRARRHEG